MDLSARLTIRKTASKAASSISQAILISTEKYMILGGVGGAMYVGGFLNDAQGQGGPDLGFYYRPWQLGVSAQAGYGNAHQYGQISMYKQLSWFE